MRRNKFNAKKTELNGIIFDSQKEARRYSQLLLLERAKEIKDIELQPRFELIINDKPVKIRSKGFPNGRKCSYKADFRYYDNKTQQVVVEEVKGFDDTASRLRRAVVECIYDIKILIT